MAFSREVESGLVVWDSFVSMPPTARARLTERLRRAGPVALAVGLHGVGMAALIWLAASPDFAEAPRRIVNVELVTPALLPASQPEAPPQTAAQQEASVPPAPPVSAPASRPVEAAAEPAPQVEDEGSGDAALLDVDIPDAVVLDAPGGTPGETAFATRSSALRGLACARAFGGEGDQIGCEGAPAVDFARYADGEGAASVDALMQARFNSLAGLFGAHLDPSLRRLPGQQGMQVMANQRMGMSGADEMRDSLPPMVPDPAFGD